jgi:protein SCO1
MVMREKTGDPIPTELQDILIKDPRPVVPFRLTDHNGKDFQRERLQGKWSLIFFGYTHCPDICPTSLGLLADLLDKLKRTPVTKQPIQGIFISVDPNRDDRKLLKSYVRYFHPDLMGATGSPAWIRGLIRQFGGGYQLEKEDSGEGYLVSHSASIYLIDPQGYFVAGFNPNDLDLATWYKKLNQLIKYFVMMKED